MPRVNFAYDLSGDGKTIFRGGFGIFYNREQGNAQHGIINVAPNSYAVTLDAGNLTGLGGGQGPPYKTMGNVDPFSQVGGTYLSTMSIDKLDWPRMYQTSFSVARRIPWNHTF